MFFNRLLVSLAIPALIGAAPTLPSDVHENIIGGTPANTNEFPFIVSIQEKGFHFCGGILVNPDTVVTAAHCMVNQTLSITKIRAGSMKKDTGGVLVSIRKVTMTRGFSTVNMKNDIAVLKLSASVLRSPSVGYATLARKGFKPSPGTVLTAAGWGSMNPTYDMNPDQLYKVKVPVVKKSQCRKRYVKKHMNNSQFCALAPGGGKDVCRGDSGGPIVDSKNTVVGLVSWGKECGSSKFPTVYTNIGSFHNFIKKNEKF